MVRTRPDAEAIRGRDICSPGRRDEWPNSNRLRHSYHPKDRLSLPAAAEYEGMLCRVLTIESWELPVRWIRWELLKGIFGGLFHSYSHLGARRTRERSILARGNCNIRFQRRNYCDKRRWSNRTRDRDRKIYMKPHPMQGDTADEGESTRPNYNFAYCQCFPGSM